MIYTQYHFEQRSPKWHEIRKGVLTASEFGAWLLKKDKRSQDAKAKAIARCVSQIAGGWEPDIFETEAMRRGTEMEPEAVEHFELQTGLKVRPVGFCLSTEGRFGCSPDGLIGDDSGFEGKVPIGPTHVYYRREGVLPDAYKLQVHGCMAVTGAKTWWFQSYNRGLASLRLEVERDDFTEELLAGLKSFSRELEAAIAEEGRAWDDEYGTIQS